MIQCKIVGHSEFLEVQRKYFKQLFDNRADDLSSESVTVPENPYLTARKKLSRPFELFILVYLDNQAVGWHYGYATQPDTFYMQNSAILQEYQGRGIYGQMLDFIIEHLRILGFSTITSLHHANNTRVLIPKLRRGFFITGVQYHERFRFLVELKYFTDPQVRKLVGRNMGLDL